MLPSWLIKKIDKKKKDNFIQEQLYIEPYPNLQEIPKLEKKDIEESHIVIIDMF